MTKFQLLQLHYINRIPLFIFDGYYLITNIDPFKGTVTYDGHSSYGYGSICYISALNNSLHCYNPKLIKVMYHV